MEKLGRKTHRLDDGKLLISAFFVSLFLGTAGMQFGPADRYLQIWVNGYGCGCAPAQARSFSSPPPVQCCKPALHKGDPTMWCEWRLLQNDFVSGVVM